MRAAEVCDGLGNGERHVAGPGAGGRLGGHDGGAGEARGAAHDQDAAARVLVHDARGGHEHVEVVRGLAAPGHGVRLIDELGRLLGERRHDNRAADVSAVIGQQAWLEGQHGDCDVCHDDGARGMTRLRGQTARDVDGHDARA